MKVFTPPYSNSFNGTINPNNMNTEITNEFRAPCFGTHYGCLAQWSDDRNENEPKIIGQIVEVTNIDVTIKDDKGALHTCMLFESQLLLQSLSLITDEDAIEVAKMLYPNHAPAFGVKMGKKIIDEMQIGGQLLCGAIAVIDYLRSKSYMIPFRGVDLFTAGIAITKP